MPRANVIIESEHEDYRIIVRHIGKRVIISTGRAGIAHNIYRKLVSDLSESEVNPIGFDTSKQE